MTHERVEDGRLISKVDNGPESGPLAGPFKGLEMVADAVDFLYSRQSLGKVVVQL